MSLLCVTIRKARLQGSQDEFNSYAVVKLQNVKSTTIAVKGNQPCWEQEFIFETNRIDNGMLLELWNKGVLWDKLLGVHYLTLTSVQYSNEAGPGKWLQIDQELETRNGQTVGTSRPTGHSILVDVRFELPYDAQGANAEELQEKLQALNRLIEIGDHWQEERAPLIRSGISEDSDYTSDVSFPVHHPNSSAHQWYSHLHQNKRHQRQYDKNLLPFEQASYEDEEDAYRQQFYSDDNEQVQKSTEYYDDMLGYSTEVNASLSRHQYSRETVRQESMLRNVYNIENNDEYDRSERNRNSLNYDNDYHDRHYYDPVEQSDDYFQPSTSGEQYQSDEYHNDNEAREQWDDEQNMDWTEEQEPLSYNSRPQLIHQKMFPMRRHYHDDDDDDEDGDDDDDDNVDVDDDDNDDDDNEIWHDYSTVMQNKSSTLTNQYDMPPTESEHESLDHPEMNHYYINDLNNHQLNFTNQQLPNGSINNFDQMRYDHNKQYSINEKQEIRNELNEAQYSFERHNNDEMQSKILKVQFTMDDNQQMNEIERINEAELILSKRNYKNLWHKAYEDTCRILGIKDINILLEYSYYGILIKLYIHTEFLLIHFDFRIC